MKVFHASWIVPIEGRPIRQGWIATDRGRIVAVGSRAGDRAGSGEPVVDLGAVAVLPGLVNAHTHLELSWMRGAVASGDRFTDWIRRLLAVRGAGPPGGDEEVRAALGGAMAECRRTGTVLVGDVSNTLATVAPLGASDLHATVFHELIGFRADAAPSLVEQAEREKAAATIPANVRVAPAAHAPYSVSPALFQAIRRVLAKDPFAPSSVHLGESAEELEFLRRGTGPWRTLLEDLGAWDRAWVVPACDPATYLDRIGFLDARVLCVHGVHLDAAALERLARRRVCLVTCPRGNRLTGAGRPPIAGFYRAGLRVAVGTDSLASVPDLNLFAELAELGRLAPEVPPAVLLESATLTGARALGWDAEFGSIEAGKRAALVAVAVPPEVADVEQYLVRGIDPEQISWLPT